ncbi:MAG: ABC-F family ATP-binding cassette domain-containing protein [Planctomycetes bacterium]|nr:ABC-F family ATP-binding cassette domain-containing protein [Planctomycetota bacterium]
MALLTLEDIHYTVGDRYLLQGVSIVINEGDRLGLVGPNGAGKSTLLRILAGDLQPDRGQRTVRRDLAFAYLPQEPALDPDATIHQVVHGGLPGRALVLHEIETLHGELAAADLPAERLERLLRRQERLEQRLAELGGHDVEHKVAAVLDHLGLPDPQARCGNLSGGERRRTALARILVGAPELVLLDEPTNHLDAQVTQWLEDFLREQDTPLILVTHDRYFLDRLVDRVVEIEHGKLHEYEGGYRGFVVQRAERLEREHKTERSRLNLLRRETEWMKRGPPARTTKAKARIGRFDAIVAAAPPASSRDLAFAIPEGPRLGDRVLRLSGIGKRFGARTVLQGLDLEIGSGERVGIIGPNGAGKTTLLKICQGLLAPDTGEVSLGSTVVFASIDQQRSDLDPDKTVLQEVAAGNDWIAVGDRTLRIETFLEQFLFPGERKHARIGTLSGGERNRVLLAKLLSRGGNVLVLDEPTNDLDLMSLRALEEALLAFSGSVLVVSHDRWFLDRIASRIVWFDGQGQARVHEGDLSLLLDRLANAAAAAPTPAAARPAKAAEPAAPKARKLSTREQQELAALPDQIAAAERELTEVDQALADPAIYGPGARDRCDRLTRRRAALPDEITGLYARWEELEAIAEQSRKGR